EKYLFKNMSKLLSDLSTIEKNDDFINKIFYFFMVNCVYILIYTISMFFIESIGKIAVKKATDNIFGKFFSAKLSTIPQKKYEYDVMSIVYHSDNVDSSIRNLFIEFPRKILASWHFLVALNELSMEVMVYCLFINILFIGANILISIIR